MKVRISIISIIIFLINGLSVFSQNLERVGETPVFSAGGSLGLNLSYYGVSGIPERYRPFDYSLLGSFTVNLFGIAFPFTATVSQQNRSFIQPFNQYGVSPKYKWITAHAGWRSLNYSPYTLAGHTFLGGGIDINPGLFRFSAMYGRFLAATAGSSDSAAFYTINPTYERRGYAIKAGIGTSGDYADLILLKGWDLPHSISDSVQALSDSLNNMVKPAENMVMGLTSRFSLFSVLNFDIDGAASLYTLDTRASAIPDSSISGLFKALNGIFAIHTSTQLTTALQTGVTYRGSGYSLRLAYKRIDPDYKSMGMYYSESDVENITFAPTFSLAQNALRLGGSIGVQKDNLLNTKSNTSNRIIGSADVSYNQPFYGIDLKYSTYGITQARGLNPVIDSIKIARVNHNFNVIGRYTLSGEKSIHNFLVMCGYQTLVDNNSYTAGNTETQNYTVTLTYQSTLTELGLSYGANINAVHSTIGSLKNIFIGPVIQINYAISSFSIGGAMGYQLQNVNGASAGATTTLTLQSGYQLTKAHSLRLDMNLINSKTDVQGNPRFTEYRTSIGYVYNF